MSSPSMSGWQLPAQSKPSTSQPLSVPPPPTTAATAATAHAAAAARAARHAQQQQQQQDANAQTAPSPAPSSSSSYNIYPTMPPALPYRTAGPPSLASLYPSSIAPPLDIRSGRPLVSAMPGFSQAARRARQMEEMMKKGELGASTLMQHHHQQQQQQHQGVAHAASTDSSRSARLASSSQPIPPTVTYPASSLLAHTGGPRPGMPSYGVPAASPSPALPPSGPAHVPHSRASPAASPATHNINTHAANQVGRAIPGSNSPRDQNKQAGALSSSVGAPSASPSSVPRSGHAYTHSAGAMAAMFAGASAAAATPGATSTLLSGGRGSPSSLTGAMGSTFNHAAGVGHALQLQAQQQQHPQQEQRPPHATPGGPLHKISLDIGQPLNALSPSPDRQLIAVAGREIKILQRTTRGGPGGGPGLELHRAYQMHSKSPTALADLQWHPMEAYKYWLATAPTNGKILLYHLGSREGLKRAERLLDDHERTVNRLHWHPHSGELLFSGSQDGTVKMFDLRSATNKAVQYMAEQHSVRDLQVNPFNPNILAAAYENGSIQIWDVRKGSYFHAINAHQGLILTLDWHPQDQDILASGGLDRMIKVWNLASPGFSSATSSSNVFPSLSSSLSSTAGSTLSDSSSASNQTTNQTQPLHVIQTLSSVGRIKWRPSVGGKKYPFQIASAASNIDAKIHLWNVHRPFVPLASLMGHKDVVTGFFWCDGEYCMESGGEGMRLGGTEIISCSKDSTVQHHYLYVDPASQSSYHWTQYPHQLLSTSAVSWNVKGAIATVNDYIDRRNTILEPDPTLPGPFSFAAHHPVSLSTSTVSGNNAVSPRTSVGQGQGSPSSTLGNPLSGAVLASILAGATGGPGSARAGLTNGIMRIFDPNVQMALVYKPIEGVEQEGDVPYLSEEEAFVYFARHYKFTSQHSYTSSDLLAGHDPCNGPAPPPPPSTPPSAVNDETFVTLCRHNSNVARDIREYELAQVWLFLAQLLGPGKRIEKAESSGPPPLPMDEPTPSNHKTGTATGNKSSESQMPNRLRPHSVTFVPGQSYNPSTALHRRSMQEQHGENVLLASTVAALQLDANSNAWQQYLQVDLVEDQTSSAPLPVQPLVAEVVAPAAIKTMNKESESNGEQGDHDAEDERKSKESLDAHTLQLTHSASISRAPATSPPTTSSPSSPAVRHSTSSSANPSLSMGVLPSSISASNRSQILLDCLPTIHKSHCYVLPASNEQSGDSSRAPTPTSRLVRRTPGFEFNPFNAGLSIPSSLLFQSRLVETLLEHRIERGDVQCCVAIMSLLKEFHVPLLDCMERLENAGKIGKDCGGHTLLDRVKQWYWSYIDLLQRHELYSHASEIIQLCNDPDLKKMNQKSTTVSLICPVCKHPSQTCGNACTSKGCSKTRMTNCSICNEPVTGVYVWCQGCGHGGHMQHMHDWFDMHAVCPTGCLHKCVNLMTMLSTAGAGAVR